ncbi:hypothetical protein HNY73_006667 [Argiope bruennichi]|uniref:Uncharacterized protein n=1 Tax=Argiope bruennichi TaxID=94029 RepID=A0A8T0FBW3_ARGBR|nr:hypothetical protein HNY73_006667 [Argiope bruennichi]
MDDRLCHLGGGIPGWVRLPMLAGASRGGGRLRPAVVRGLRQQPAQVSGDSGAVPCEGVPRLRCRRGSVGEARSHLKKYQKIHGRLLK